MTADAWRPMEWRARPMGSTMRLVVGAVLAAGACSPGAGEAGATRSEGAPPGEMESAAPQEAHNTLTAEERAAGWRLLFDGESTEGWRGYMREDMPGGWRVEDGTLTRAAAGGDIVTTETFADFELTVDWRLEPGGNSGVFFRAIEGPEYVYHSGPEMQVLDDSGHPDGGDPLTSAGSNYGLHPAPRGVVRPVGEWNESRIVVEGRHVEHWLNGQKVVEYEFGSDDWERRVAGSKFAEWPPYGRAEEGYIGLQDHGSRVWFRNVKIRPIG